MSYKPKYNEAGQLVVLLPYSKQTYLLRRPKAKDLKTLEFTVGNELSATIQMIACLAEVPLAEVEELDMEDMEVLGEALTTFPVFRKRQ